jgi:hypothetical protein
MTVHPNNGASHYDPTLCRKRSRGEMVLTVLGAVAELEYCAWQA